MRTLDDLLNALAFHPATPETAKKYDQIRTHFIELARKVSPLLPDGPDKTTAHRAIVAAQRECVAVVAVNEAPADWENPHIARVLPHGDVSMEGVHLPEDTCACGETRIPPGFHTGRQLGSDIVHVRKETGETCGTT